MYCWICCAVAPTPYLRSALMISSAGSQASALPSSGTAWPAAFMLVLNWSTTVLACPVRVPGDSRNCELGKYSWPGSALPRPCICLKDSLPLLVMTGRPDMPSCCRPDKTVVSGVPVVHMKIACGLAALILASLVVTLTAVGSKVWWLTMLTAPSVFAAALLMLSHPSWPEESVEVMAATCDQPFALAKLMNASVWLVVEFDAEYTELPTAGWSPGDRS